MLNTHISARESGEDLEFFKRKPFGGHKIKEDLKLTAPQETPFQKLSTWCADSQFANLFSRLLIGLGW